VDKREVDKEWVGERVFLRLALHSLPRSLASSQKLCRSAEAQEPGVTYRGRYEAALHCQTSAARPSLCRGPMPYVSPDRTRRPRFWPPFVHVQ
jgi:hypothetical protein